MAGETDEKKKLATFVKSVHKDLRRKFKAGEREVEDIWKEHCQDKGKLQEYAEAMQRLATLHWGNQQQERVHWCREMLLEYFKDGGMEKCIEKDRRRLQRQCMKDGLFDSNIAGTQQTPPLQQDTKYFDKAACLPKEPLVLDVGSCYNPFKEMTEFKVIGVDLHPATEDVYQCDFLSLDVVDHTESSIVLSSPITQLPSCVFNVIIFCLLLEYFPSCRQRWQCCVQAHKLLAPNGLLVIITPDSHKQHRNASMIRSWNSAITAMGFSKYKYEKHEHIHCIVFRKVRDECCVNEEMVDHMFIHQDALEENIAADMTEACDDKPLKERDIEYIRHTMLELPGQFSDTDD